MNDGLRLDKTWLSLSKSLRKKLKIKRKYLELLKLKVYTSTKQKVDMSSFSQLVKTRGNLEPETMDLLYGGQYKKRLLSHKEEARLDRTLCPVKVKNLFLSTKDIKANELVTIKKVKRAEVNI